MACASYRVYHHNAFGVVSSCPCNNAIQLLFGNVALLLSEEEFKQVHDYLVEMATHCPGMLDPAERNITIKTPVYGLAFVFNLQELEQLLDLTRNTRLLLEAERILEN